MELAPNEATSYHGLGAFHVRQHQFSAAAAAFSKAIKMAPGQSGQAQGYAGLGESCLRMGRIEDALANVTEALRLDPDCSPASRTLARMLACGPPSMRNAEKAVSIARRAPFDAANNQLILGAAYYRLGRYENATDALRRAVELTGECDMLTEVSMFLAMAYSAVGQHEHSLVWFKRGMAWFANENAPADRYLQGICSEAADVLRAPTISIVSPPDNGSLDLDRRQGQMLVSRAQPALSFEIFPRSTQVIEPTDLSCDLQLTRDGQPLQTSIDYASEHDSGGAVITITRVNGVFDDGVYRLSYPRSTELGRTWQSEIVVVVSRQLPLPRCLTFRNGFGGYQSADHVFEERVMLVPEGAQWRYSDDGTDQGEAWRQPVFDDSTWKAGHGELGYGDGDETTAIRFGSDPTRKYATAYFRHTFEVADPLRIPLLQLGLLTDDGAAVYLNGNEIIRDNLLPGAGYNTYAEAAVGGSAESQYIERSVDRMLLVKGRNCLAVEVHQNAPDSSDLSFDLRLASPPLCRVIFQEFLGDSSQQIAKGAEVVHATLTVPTDKDNLKDDVRLARLYGKGNSDREKLVEERRTGDVDGRPTFDVARSVQAWCDGEPNHGWLLLTAGAQANVDAEDMAVELRVHFLSAIDKAVVASHFANAAKRDAVKRE